jgi:glycine/D-amino acid oxidase-like deaminating enzyme/nitrite reductase/ring-hydroxylating ferredoxin subunit
VVGAGLSGILTALLLGERGVDCAVFEAGELGGGQSGNTTAKITCQQGLKYAELEKKQGADAAQSWAQSCKAAIDAYEALTKKYALACDFVRLPAMLYTRCSDELLEEEAIAARRAGIPAELKRRTTLPFDISLALSFPGQAQFHPLRFLYGIAKQVKVWCGTRVTSVMGHRLYTDEGDEIEAQKLVWACHYPPENFPGMYFTRLTQSRSYALALHGIPPLGGMYYGIDEHALSLRSVGDTLILVGCSHRTGETPADPYASLRAAAHRYYPDASEVAAWSAQDCMSPDGLPLAGVFSPLTPDRYLATGYSKWGMTGAMLAAQIITADICGESHPAAHLCAPNRFGLAQLRATVAGSGYALRGLGKSLLHLPAEAAEELMPGQASIAFKDGKKCGVYRDPAGVLHTVSPYCTHLGCELCWNPADLTWDCPCHGSRFSPDGEPIDSPATKPLTAWNRQTRRPTDEKTTQKEPERP